ncbi:MarR family transcriptional regulator [Rhizobiaceae bacterium BDR2-2]|uniref:MarR family transcriptional regulator n=1 Tax=Ectorhizobium quercum TaxID=2965071 RepID=A0AAE3SUN0_9HYPH|nr:MarR family transcriptional regulator [Ectorhizobium quercum]MCX8996863.1 MarR family transcriptional regulator [Ectorhizobium quercum]
MRKKEKSLRKKEEALAEPGALANSLVQASRSLRTLLSRALTRTGLYAGQDGVILALHEQDGLTTGQLAQALGVKPPTVTRTIGRMEAQGFLMRGEDAKDGRLSKVYLTDMGRSAVEAISASVVHCDRAAVAGLSGKEVKTLIRLLKTVDANLNSAGQAPEPTGKGEGSPG